MPNPENTSQYLYMVTLNGHTTFIIQAESAPDALEKISPDDYVHTIEVVRIDPTSPVKITE